MHDAGDLTNAVRVHVYRYFVERGRPPMPLETASDLGIGIDDVTTALRRLHDDDVIVLMPGTSFVWLAHPFSALAAPFEVSVGRQVGRRTGSAGRPQRMGRRTGSAGRPQQRWDAICIWDGLGVLAVLERDGVVRTLCPDCAEPLEVEVRDGEVISSHYVVHYGVPAARWYEDVAYT